MSSNKAILTCAVTGVLTDPKRFPVPVTVEEMAQSCKEAYDAGASIMHLHFRDQRPGMGRMPSWDPDVAEAITNAVREACPDVIINIRIQRRVDRKRGWCVESLLNGLTWL